MGSSPDERNRLRADIESTRADLAHDVERLADRASPRNMVHRRRERMKETVAGARERVMGSASHGREQARERGHRATESVQETTGQAADSLKRAPHRAAERTEGNPLAAGMIAFGAGMLAASLLPKSEAETRMASRMAEESGGVIEPVKEAAMESGRHLKEDASRTAREAADELKRSAAEAARTTGEDARDQAKQMRGRPGS